MGKRGDSKPKYPQPHNIRPVKTGNPALDDRIREKGHVSAKKWAKMTNSQKRIWRRRERVLDLASQDRIYCNSHQRYLCVRDVVDKKCYMRHGKPPVCTSLMYEDSQGVLKFYGR